MVSIENNKLTYKNPFGEKIILESNDKLGTFAISTGELRSDFFRDLRLALEKPFFIIKKEQDYFYIYPLSKVLILVVLVRLLNDQFCIEDVNTESDMNILKELIQKNIQVYVRGITKV